MKQNLFGPKKRLDILLFDLGLAPSRQRAQALILSGNVLVNDTPITQPGKMISSTSKIRIREKDHPYVSRGGVKLNAALDYFQISVSGRTALDVGASTGGFTQVLLLRGVARVFAVDVGHGQLDWTIAQDSRVCVLDKTNARGLKFEQIGEKVDIIVMDVSFISLAKVVPALIQFSTPRTDWVTLIKPQFEVGRDQVGKGGIVRSEEDRQAAIEKVKQELESLSLQRINLLDSPITGARGNKEYLAHWKLLD